MVSFAETQKECEGVESSGLFKGGVGGSLAVCGQIARLIASKSADTTISPSVFLENPENSKTHHKKRIAIPLLWNISSWESSKTSRSSPL